MKRIVIALIMAVMLTACGNTGTEVQTETTSAETPTETAIVTEAETNASAATTNNSETETTKSETTAAPVQTTTVTTTTAASEKGLTLLTAIPVVQNTLKDIVGDKFYYTPDIYVNVSLADISRAQYVELINDVKYCDEVYSFISCGYCSDDFYYYYDKLLILYEGESEYCKVKKDVATNLDEIYSFARSCFSNNFISDDELYDMMFKSDNNMPNFIMVDNQLAVYTWSPHWASRDYVDYGNAGVVSYTGTEATVWVAENEALDPGFLRINIFYMVRDSESQKWKLDRKDIINRWELDKLDEIK